MARCCIVYQSGYSECSCFWSSSQSACESLPNIYGVGSNAWDPVIASTWYEADADCYALCPSVAANAMCANAGGSSCVDGVLASQCTTGTFIPRANCSACSGQFTAPAYNGLTDVKIYLNTTDYICVPVACGDCAGYEICEAS